MTISFSGLASGLDTSSWVESLVALKRAKVTTLQTKKENVITAKDTLSSIKSFFASFRSTIEKITDSRFNIVSMDLFAQNLATSADLNVLTATATHEAKEATYNIKVDKLATKTNVKSNFKKTTTVTETSTATTDSKLIHLGVRTGTIGVTVDGIKHGITITDNDTIGTFIEKLKEIGVDAFYNEMSGIFSMDLSAGDIDDSISNTRIVEAFHLEGVNEGYANDTRLELKHDETVTILATETTYLKDLGVDAGAITIKANGVNNTINITETMTIGGLISDLQSKNIDSSFAEGVFTLLDAEIVKDTNGTNFISDMGLVDDIYSKSQATGALSRVTIVTEITTATAATLLKDIGDGTAISNGQTVIVKNSNNEYKTIAVGTSTSIGNLLAEMTNAGLYAAINSDGTVEITGGTITGGTFDAISALGLETEPYTAMTTGDPLTETIIEYELVTYDTDLVTDLQVRKGYLKVIDADGNVNYQKIYAGLTIGDLMADLANMGIDTRLDMDTGILTITGGAFETLTDDEVRTLVANNTIAETDSAYIQGTDLLECLYGDGVISTDQISVASAYSRTRALRQSVTNTINATTASTLETIGVTGTGAVTFDARGEEKTINITSGMTIAGFMNALEAQGIESSWDADFSRITINNATLKADGTTNLADVLNLTTEIAGKYVTSTALKSNTTVTISATTETTFAELGVNSSQQVVLNKEDGTYLTFTVDGTTSLGSLITTLNGQGVTAKLENGVFSIDGGYLTNDVIVEALGLTSVTNGYSNVLGTKVTHTITTTATEDSTLGDIISELNTTSAVSGGYTLSFNENTITVSENTTLREVMNQIHAKGGTVSIDGAGRLHIDGGTLTGTVATALGFSSVVNTASVSATGETLKVITTISADSTTKLSDLGLNATVLAGTITIKGDDGVTIGTVTTNAGMTIGDVFTALAGYGISGTINDGRITLTSDQNRYATGGVIDAWGIGTEQTNYTTTAGVTNTSTAAVTGTIQVYATLDSFIGSFITLGTSAENTITIRDADGNQITTFEVTSSTKFEHLFDALGENGIQASLSDGVITITSNNGNYITGDALLNKLGIDDKLTTITTTIGTSESSSDSVTATVTKVADMNSKINDYITPTNRTITIHNSDGSTKTTVEIAEGATFQGMFYALSTLGIQGTISDGVVTLTSNDGSYASGDIIDKLGVTPVTVGQSYTTTTGTTKTGTCKIQVTTNVVADMDSKVKNYVTNATSNTIDVYDSNGTKRGSITVDDTTTFQNMFDALSSLGIQGTISDGVVTLTSTDGSYATGDVLTKMGIGTKDAVSKTTVVVGTVAQSSSAITSSIHETATMDSTISSYISGINGKTLIVNDENGNATHTITLDNTDTFMDIFNELSTHGIQGTMSDGVIMFTSNNGYYLEGTALTSFGITNNTTNITSTAGIASTGSNVIQVTTNVVADMDSKVKDYVTADNYTINVYDSNGTKRGSITVDDTTSFQNMFDALSSLGIQGTISDGVVTLTSTDGSYATGDVLTKMGIETKDAESSTVINTGTNVTSNELTYQTTITTTTLGTTTSCVTTTAQITVTVPIVTTLEVTTTGSIQMTTVETVTAKHTLVVSQTIEGTSSGTVTITVTQTLTEGIATTTTRTVTTQITVETEVTMSELITTTDKVEVTITTMVQATGDTKLSDLNITETALTILTYNTLGECTSTIAVTGITANTTLQGLINSVSTNSSGTIIGEINNGVLTFTDSNGVTGGYSVVTGALAEALGIEQVTSGSIQTVVAGNTLTSTTAILQTISTFGSSVLGTQQRLWSNTYVDNNGSIVGNSTIVEIRTGAALIAMGGKTYENKTFILTGNLDVVMNSGINLENCVFDAQGYTILTQGALFNEVNNSTIKNLSADIQGTVSGGLATEASGSNFENIRAWLYVNSNSIFFGGIVGDATNCNFNTIAISGYMSSSDSTRDMGGIIGEASHCNLNSISFNLTGFNDQDAIYAGGLVGCAVEEVNAQYILFGGDSNYAINGGEIFAGLEERTDSSMTNYYSYTSATASGTAISASTDASVLSGGSFNTYGNAPTLMIDYDYSNNMTVGLYSYEGYYLGDVTVTADMTINEFCDKIDSINVDCCTQYNSITGQLTITDVYLDNKNIIEKFKIKNIQTGTNGQEISQQSDIGVDFGASVVGTYTRPYSNTYVDNNGNIVGNSTTVEIRSGEALAAMMGKSYGNRTFILTCDVTVSSSATTGINLTNCTFDGQGYNIDMSLSNASLFETVNSGSIYNLSLTGVANGAGLAKRTENNTSIDRIRSNVSVGNYTDNTDTGGVVAHASDTTFSQISYAGELSGAGYAYAGGIAGYAENDCYFYDISVTASVISGYTNALGVSLAGGIAGYAEQSTFDDIYLGGTWCDDGYKNLINGGGYREDINITNVYASYSGTINGSATVASTDTSILDSSYFSTTGDTPVLMMDHDYNILTVGVYDSYGLYQGQVTVTADTTLTEFLADISASVNSETGAITIDGYIDNNSIIAKLNLTTTNSGSYPNYSQTGSYVATNFNSTSTQTVTSTSSITLEELGMSGFATINILTTDDRTRVASITVNPGMTIDDLNTALSNTNTLSGIDLTNGVAKLRPGNGYYFSIIDDYEFCDALNFDEFGDGTSMQQLGTVTNSNTKSDGLLAEEEQTKTITVEATGTLIYNTTLTDKVDVTHVITEPIVTTQSLTVSITTTATVTTENDNGDQVVYFSTIIETTSVTVSTTWLEVTTTTSIEQTSTTTQNITVTGSALVEFTTYNITTTTPNVTASGASTLGQLGLNGTYTITVNSSGTQYEVKVEKDDTIDDMLTALAGLGIHGTIDAGKITFKGDNDAYIVGMTNDLRNKLLGNSSNNNTFKTTTTLTTTVKVNTTSDKQDYNTEHNMTTDSTLSQCGMTAASGTISIINNGIAYDVTVDKNDTVGEMLIALAGLGISGEITNDGKLKLTGSGDAYITSITGLDCFGLNVGNNNTYTIKTDSTGYNTTSSIIQSHTVTTGLADATTTLEQLGLSNNQTITVNSNGNTYSFTLNQNNTINDLLTALAGFGISGNITNGSIKITGTTEAYITDMSDDLAGKLKIDETNFTTNREFTTTVKVNTTSDKQNSYTTTFNMTTDSTLSQCGMANGGTITVVSHGTQRVVTVDANDTVGEMLIELAGFGISGEITNDGKLKLTGSKDCYVTGITGDLTKFGITTGLNNTYTTSVQNATVGFNTTSTVHSQSTFTENMTTASTFAEIGVTNNIKMTVVSNGTSHDLEFNANDTIDDMLTTLAGLGISGYVQDGRLYLDGSEHTYISSIDNTLQTKLKLDGSYTTKSTVTTGYNTSTGVQERTITIDLAGQSTFAELGMTGDGTITVVSDKETYIVTVNANDTIDDMLTALAGLGIHGSIENNIIKLQGDDEAYIKEISNNIVNALKLGATNYTTTSHTKTANTVSDEQKETITAVATGTTTLGDLRHADGSALSNFVLELTTKSDAGNETLSHTFTNTDTVYDVIDYLAEHGLNAYIDSTGRFAVNSSSLSDFTISGALGQFLMGSYTKLYDQGSIDNVSTVLVEETVVNMDNDTLLSKINVTNGNIILYQNGTETTISIDNSETVGDFRAKLAEYGIDSEIIDGKLMLTGDGVVYLKKPTSGASNITDIMGINHPQWSLGDYSQESKDLTDTRTDVISATMDTKISQLTDNSGNPLGVTAGQIYVYQDGTRNVINIDTNDTLQNLANKLSQYGITMDISSDGKVYLNGNNNSYLTTNGIAAASASNILTKFNISDNWSTRYNSTSGTLTFEETNNKEEIDGSTKIVDLYGSDGSKLGITEGNYYVYQNGVRTTESITEDTTVDDFKAVLATYGMTADFDENGQLAVGGYNETYLATSETAGDDTNAIDVLFEKWNFIKVYESNNLEIPTDVTVAISETTKLADINEGATYVPGYITVVKDGVQTDIELTANDTVGDLMDELALYGFESVINANGQLIIKNTGDSLLQAYNGSGTASNALTILGVELNDWINTNTYSSQIIDVITTDTQTVAADRSTKLKELNLGSTISTGEYYIYKDGVKYTAYISSDETLGSLIDTLESYGIQTSLVDNGNNAVLSIEGNGNCYVAKSSSTNASNVVEKLFTAASTENYIYTGVEKTYSIETHTVAATETTLISQFNGGIGINENISVTIDGVTCEIQVEADDTIGDLLNKFNTLGLNASIKDGYIVVQSGYKEFTVNSDTTSDTFGSLDLGFVNELGGYVASGDETEQTITIVEEKTLSAADYANENTQLKLLNITNGTLTIYRDGEKATINIDNEDTFSDLNAQIASKFGDVSIEFKDGYLKDGYLTIKSNTPGVRIEVGSTTDTSNFAAITGITRQDNGTAKSARELYCVNNSSKITESGIFVLGDVTTGTFKIGDEVFEITEDTTIANIVSQINASEKANATAYWDSVDGKLVIQSHTTGAALINVEAITSNFTDILGLTNTDWAKISTKTLATANESTKLVNLGASAGTFSISDGANSTEFIIDGNTTIESLIADINASDFASAKWDNDNKKIIIGNKGNNKLNYIAGTSNILDVLGLTVAKLGDSDGDGQADINNATKMVVEAQELGDNAVFAINGTYYTSTSNEISSAVSKIDGVTINLKGISEGETTLKIERDKETIANAVSDVVDAYNELIANVDKELSKGAPLADQTSLKFIRNQIRSLMTSSIAGISTFKNLDQIGITLDAASASNISTDRINVLTFNKDKFISAFDADRDAVKNLLVGTETTNGIFQNVENIIETAVDGGYFTSAERSYTNQISRLDDKITKAQKTVERYQQMLEAKFASMDLLISQMQNQYSSFLGY